MTRQNLPPRAVSPPRRAGLAIGLELFIQPNQWITSGGGHGTALA